MNKILNKVLTWIKKEYNAFVSFFTNTSAKVIKFLAEVKKAIDNPALDVLVSLTENKFDDKVLKAIRAALANLTEGPLSTTAKKAKIDLEQLAAEIKKFIEGLKTTTAPVQDAMLFKLGSQTVKEMAAARGEVLTDSEADTIFQMHFKQVKDGLLKA